MKLGPWAKVYSELLHDAKKDGLTIEDIGTYIAAILYSQAHATDGVVPLYELRWGRKSGPFRASVSRLLVACWFSEGTHGCHEAVLIRSYLKHNRSREEIVQVREMEAERKRNKRSGKAQCPEDVRPDILNVRHSGTASASGTGTASDTIKNPLPPSQGVVPVSDSGLGHKLSVDSKAVVEHWRAAMGKPRAIANTKRKKLIADRAREGYTIEDMKRAIDGCRNSPWHMGDNDRGTAYNSLELILRDGERLEQFSSYVDNPPRAPQRKMATCSNENDFAFDSSTLPEAVRNAIR